MEMSNMRIVPAPPERVWSALNDAELLKACITGCEVMELVGDNEYKVLMAVKIGPVSARFAGRILIVDLNPPESYTLNFEGQGGMAGFAKGMARVLLAAEGEVTRLDYTASAQIGGKLAQIGSRLVDGAATKMANDFFAAFARELEKIPEPAADETQAEPADAGGQVADGGAAQAEQTKPPGFVADQAQTGPAATGNHAGDGTSSQAEQSAAPNVRPAEPQGPA